MKQYIFSFTLLLISLSCKCQTVVNNSYVNSSGEKVLRIESILPVDLKTAWEYFTIDEKLKKWIAPLAHIELRTGGFIITNYDINKKLSDSSSIKLPIVCHIDAELIVLKVNLNTFFPSSVRNTDENLQEIIQFIKIDDHKTKVISSMVGWGISKEWEKTYDFFAKGNEWTYNELLKCFK